ncbi:hypothetical protein ASG39_12935 [Rhizobium sp. Leaf371]|uniref:phosphatidylglycerol lysyltransferase domain-containing protein n=1 Tax=unclassified Rhizobium TaxID=2613769 RepID=UPI00071618F8|nr:MULTISPECIES: phosphatidylglycerol lysyltransferase domain-containing protein [unclassified Rhizobium]KQS64084.1 hypothetical protein ASG39_12935 [Rhizobium sp. Leaf371]TCM53090.1 uncharacterized protein DUF2156 [Rhizobium sp. PP-F2F-G48]
MSSLRKRMDAILNARLPQLPAAALDAPARLELLRKYGDFSVAYSTYAQPDLQYFGDAEGYIAYATKMGHTFVLGDPVADPARRADYIRRFVAASNAPCFVQTSRETAAVLETLGYRINHMGVDTKLSLDTHSFSGKRNETIRYSERWLLKKNYRLIECDGSIADAQKVRDISSNWRSGRIVSRREMRFLNRPFGVQLAPFMRRFLIIDPDGHPVAVLDFDPIFRTGEVIGYTVAFKRKLAGTTPHAEIGLTKFATDRFAAEGRAIVTFGLSPLAAITESGFLESRIWRSLFERAFHSKRVNARIFNLQGQAAFKRRFHGEEIPTYIGFKRRTPLEILSLLRLLKTL